MRARLAAGVLVAVALAWSHAAAQQRPPASGRWVTGWSTSHHTLGSTTVSNATARLIARVTISGEALRVRVANTFSAEPLRIGSAYIGVRIDGASLAASSNRPLLFAGASSVTIPPGETITSDQVAMNVLAGQDVAVSLYLPGSAVQPTQHTLAFTTSYISPDGSGDVAREEQDKPFERTTTSMFWLKAVDVLTRSHGGSVVAFGDSITDGNCSTVDGYDRWVDWLAVRLDLEDRRRSAGREFKAVLNEGISGNTIGREGLNPAPASPPGLERLERDVLSHHGVTDVIVFMGTNDIRREASADRVIAGMQELVKRFKARGFRVLGATIIPRHPNTTNSPWDARKTAIRNTVNAWIRERAPFDGVLDFDRVVRDPQDPDRIYPPFNCDEIHPTARGYYEMGLSLPLQLFQR